MTTIVNQNDFIDGQINLWMGRSKFLPMTLIVTNILDRMKSYPPEHSMTSPFYSEGVSIILEVFPGGHCREDADCLSIGLRFKS